MTLSEVKSDVLSEAGSVSLTNAAPALSCQQ